MYPRSTRRKVLRSVLTLAAADMFRATPLQRVKVKFAAKNAVYTSLRLAAYGEFDCDFDLDSQEWVCSHAVLVIQLNARVQLVGADMYIATIRVLG